MSKYFLDTSFAVALAIADDDHHREAQRAALMVQTRCIDLVTTRFVLAEIGDWFASKKRRRTGVDVLGWIMNDPAYDLVTVDDGLFNAAMEIYRNFDDKDWGLTDCISFAVMKQRGITEALTADRHFEQAGFRALLREEPGDAGEPPTQP